jgi:hypothetical protein
MKGSNYISASPLCRGIQSWRVIHLMGPNIRGDPHFPLNHKRYSWILSWSLPNFEQQSGCFHGGSQLAPIPDARMHFLETARMEDGRKTLPKANNQNAKSDQNEFARILRGICTKLYNHHISMMISGERGKKFLSA